MLSHDEHVATMRENGAVRRYLRELAEGFRILRSREFWQSFREYWSSEAVATRIDAFAARLRGESHDAD